MGDLLINSKKYLNFIAPDFLRTEIFKHHSRLCKISGMTLEQIREAEFQICKGTTFISEEQIKLSLWLAAAKLVEDIDPKDEGFTSFISTDELYKWRQNSEAAA